MFHCTTNRDQNLNIKVHIPYFTGKMQPEEVLGWLNEVERVFEFLNLPENKKVKLVADYYQKVLFCRPNYNGFKHL